MKTAHRVAAEVTIEECPPSVDPIRCVQRFLDCKFPVFFDSALRSERLGRYSYVTAEPFLTLRSVGRRVRVFERGREVDVFDGNPFTALKDILARHPATRNPDGPPFQGGAAGFFGYELAGHLERLPIGAADDIGLPDMSVGFYDWVVAFDHQTGRAQIITGPYSPPDRAAWARWRMFGAAPDGCERRPTGRIATTSPRSNFTRDEYLESVRRVKRYIAAGDIYQANISQRFEGVTNADAWSLYLALRSSASGPFGAFLRFPEADILSASPEQFLLLQDGMASTRPMKGTRPRGDSAEDDARLRRELAESEKDRAENIMIVDLLRSDLGKVCQPGSVRVPDLFNVEQYANVYQMVSSVCGKLRPEYGPVDLLTACFPGGSVTGAPKIRAMEIIHEIERVRRGVYCGSIGYIGFDGAMQMSIPIRTIIAKGRRVYLQVGGGVVADSSPELEYQETLDKARGGFRALGLADFPS